jgi:hypothetical protein
MERSNYKAKAYIPVGTSLLWDKDDGQQNKVDYLSLNFEEILNNENFILKEIPQWNKEDKKRIKEIGLEEFMIEVFKKEQ